MPPTPLHYIVAYLIGKWKQSLSLVHSVFSVLFIAILIWEAVKKTDGFWERVLVS